MTIITLNLTSFSIQRYNCLLVTKDETPTKLLSLRIMNPLIEYTVPHNGSINVCSGEILTLQTYSIMHQSFETLGHNPSGVPNGNFRKISVRKTV